MEKLLKYIVSRIVEKPESIEISSEKTDLLTLYKLKVDQSDLPLIIGKKGRVIKALRQLVRIKSSLSGQKTRLILLED